MGFKMFFWNLACIVNVHQVEKRILLYLKGGFFGEITVESRRQILNQILISKRVSFIEVPKIYIKTLKKVEFQ